jgi:hypothetical protein
LSSGTASVNADVAVAKKLIELATDLQSLGLISDSEMPAFETGAISARELLQSLRLTLPGADVPMAFAYRGSAARNAQDAAGTQARGHHQSLQRPGIGGVDTRGKRGAESAAIDVVTE